ncbi:hypothetical protein TNCV_2619761 [Trichonephila clavipes]|uniref:Uncharacterized protein n=1 Tax=Trichonephila clavipes TaxID=2585209 RepID=A0A8X6WK02_TRICX|nr:hypothetical protein TNCV_2619761 [Trichonephila clavipes]
MEGNLALTYVINVVFVRVGSLVVLGFEHMTRRLRIRDNNQLATRAILSTSASVGLARNLGENTAEESEKVYFFAVALRPCYECIQFGDLFEVGFTTEKVNSIGTASLRSKVCGKTFRRSDLSLSLNCYIIPINTLKTGRTNVPSSEEFCCMFPFGRACETAQYRT